MIERIICFDDLERKGDNLKIKDFLGFVNLLKEQRNCKVVLILNNNAFDGEEFEDFNRYFEKTVDTRIEFDPSPREAAATALNKASEHRELLQKCCIDLGITNIRVIRKIDSAVVRLVESAEAIDRDSLLQGVVTLSVFG